MWLELSWITHGSKGVLPAPSDAQPACPAHHRPHRPPWERPGLGDFWTLAPRPVRPRFSVQSYILWDSRDGRDTHEQADRARAQVASRGQHRKRTRNFTPCAALHWKLLQSAFSQTREWMDRGRACPGQAAPAVLCAGASGAPGAQSCSPRDMSQPEDLPRGEDSRGTHRQRCAKQLFLIPQRMRVF